MTNTAIEWLENKLESYGSSNLTIKNFRIIDELIAQAKKMEQQQIENTAMTCYVEGFQKGKKMDSAELIQYGEDYYKEIYGKQ